MEIRDKITEFKSISKTVTHTSIGPPRAPTLRISNIDLQAVTLEWLVADYPRPDFISGYRLLVNSQYKEILSNNQHGLIFNELKPGKSYKLELIVLTNSVIGQSEPSKPLTIVCPLEPTPPNIYQSPTMRANSVMISWNPTVPRSYNKEDQVWMYRCVVQ